MEILFGSLKCHVNARKRAAKNEDVDGACEVANPGEDGDHALAGFCLVKSIKHPIYALIRYTGGKNGGEEFAPDGQRVSTGELDP
jgi:hypothetical protein